MVFAPRDRERIRFTCYGRKLVSLRLGQAHLVVLTRRRQLCPRFSLVDTR